MAEAGFIERIGQKYIFVDGVCFHMRLEKSVENVPVLAAAGVTLTGEKLVLSLQSGDKRIVGLLAGDFQGFEGARIPWKQCDLGHHGWITRIGNGL